MSTLAPADHPDGGIPRPKTVEYAVYATIVRCFLALTTAGLIYPLHSELLRLAARQHPDWTAAQVDSTVIRPGASLISAVLVVSFTLVLAKFAWRGKNWARWLIAITSIYPLADVTKVTAIFVKDVPLALRFTLFATGAASIVALVLFFVRPSSLWFRQFAATGSGGLFGSLLKPRSGTKLSKTAPELAAKPEVPVASGTTASRPGAGRARRAKSRKSPIE